MKLDRVSIAGLVMFAAGLHLYGWYVAQLEVNLLPFEGLIVLSYVLIAFGIVFIRNSLKYKYSSYLDLLYLIKFIGAIMVVSASFTTVVYCKKYGIYFRGKGVTQGMLYLLETSNPIVPFIWGLFLIGMVMVISYTLIRIFK